MSDLGQDYPSQDENMTTSTMPPLFDEDEGDNNYHTSRYWMHDISRFLLFFAMFVYITIRVCCCTTFYDNNDGQTVAMDQDDEDDDDLSKQGEAAEQGETADTAEPPRTGQSSVEQPSSPRPPTSITVTTEQGD